MRTPHCHPTVPRVPSFGIRSDEGLSFEIANCVHAHGQSFLQRLSHYKIEHCTSFRVKSESSHALSANILMASSLFIPV